MLIYYSTTANTPHPTIVPRPKGATDASWLYRPPLSSIPPFRPDGYLPDGVHSCVEADLTFRFGSSNRRRRTLVLRVRRWIELQRLVGASRLLIDGSFVTATPEPHDVDAVILLPEDFAQQIGREYPPALELEHILLTRQPEELFAAEDQLDWDEWVEFLHPHT